MNSLEGFLQQVYWGNSVQNYAIAILLFVGLIILFKAFQLIALGHLSKLSKKTKTDFDDAMVQVLKDIPAFFYIVVSLYLSLKFLIIPEKADTVVSAVFIILVIFYVIKSIEGLIVYLFDKYARREHKGKEEVRTTLLGLKLLTKIVLWTIGLLLILSNLGVNITSLVAGLGIGGVAIALAIQNILEDLFSAFSIYVDKPFEVGDYIVIGDDEGTVNKIGLKTTRLQALVGEEIVISNRELTSARVQNFRRLKERRAAFNFNVTYETDMEKLKSVPKLIEGIIKKHKKAELNRVNLSEFGDSSLRFDVVYYVKSSSYTEYKDIQQSINFAILEKFAKEKISMAYPTRTIYLNK